MQITKVSPSAWGWQSVSPTTPIRWPSPSAHFSLFGHTGSPAVDWWKEGAARTWAGLLPPIHTLLPASLTTSRYRPVLTDAISRLTSERLLVIQFTTKKATCSTDKCLKVRICCWRIFPEVCEETLEQEQEAAYQQFQEVVSYQSEMCTRAPPRPHS